MPKEYVDLFTALQDSVPAQPGHEVKEIISMSLYQEHGLVFDDVFDSFEEIPLGSASIGQVHRARLSDKFLQKVRLSNLDTSSDVTYSYSGDETVAVKCMNFDAEDRFRIDLKIFKWFCRIVLPEWKPLMVELERQILTEFDYVNEANNLRRVKQVCK